MKNKLLKNLNILISFFLIYSLMPRIKFGEDPPLALICDFIQNLIA